MVLLTIVLICQTVFVIAAVTMNLCLIYLAIRHSHKRMGFFKWILVGYAVFEILFALVVFAGTPLHLVSDRSWIMFTYVGLLNNTRFAPLGPALYCFFYELWLVLLMFIFIYRYISICFPMLLKKMNCTLCRLFLLSFFLGFSGFCIVCIFFFCGHPQISPSVAEKLKQDYGIEHPESIGYMMLRLRNLDGEPSVNGVIAISFHYFIIICTSVGITTFSILIWRGIRKISKIATKVDVVLERQIFTVIMTQTIVPIFLCLLPSSINISFTLLNFDVNFGAFSIFFSAITTLQKAIDPVVAIYFIGDYNNAVRKILCRSVSQEEASQSYVTATNH